VDPVAAAERLAALVEAPLGVLAALAVLRVAPLRLAALARVAFISTEIQT
jgi:hypothetical protein